MKKPDQLVEQCKEWMEGLGIPRRVRKALPKLTKDVCEDTVHAALERMKRGSSPGLDGIPVEVYAAFAEVWCPL